MVRNPFPAPRGAQRLGTDAVAPPRRGPPGPIRWENCMASLASGAWGAEPSGGGERDPLGTSVRRERWASGNPSQDRCFGIKKLPSKRTGVPSNPFPTPVHLEKRK